MDTNGPFDEKGAKKTDGTVGRNSWVRKKECPAVQTDGLPLEYLKLERRGCKCPCKPATNTYKYA